MSDTDPPLRACRLCGRSCRACRQDSGVGYCGAGSDVVLSSALIHHGEEPPISGQGLSGSRRGSGTIFFARCPLHCVFCQNWQISQAVPPAGTKNPAGSSVSHLEISPEELSGIMLNLEARGALNINLVSPTPYVPQIALALRHAKIAGLRLPIVYNSGGYDSLEALRLLDGLIDIYLPDAKLAPESETSSTKDDPLTARLLGASNYVRVNRPALLEMFRQCGHLRLDERGVAYKGLLIRHLVLPGNLARTRQMIPWLAENFGQDLCLSLMAQYQPMYLVHNRPKDFRDLPDLSRPLREKEYDEAVDLALEHGLARTFIQELSSAVEYLPDFTRRKVF
ncbi:MAG: radical SAM protein [Desulfovibrionaceae bacterium]|nr:radical SAM protein [Desulfovibrionaceae bacterium]